MADFHQAKLFTHRIEGGYVDDPDDAGGETYRGIARNYHPNWVGWTYIDQIKQEYSFGEVVRRLDNPHSQIYQVLDPHVDAFYKKEFWDVYGADYISSQKIAAELYDTGVNMNHRRAAMYLQKALNSVLSIDLAEDGKCGPATRAALERALKSHRLAEETILKMLNVCQGAFYMNRPRKKPSQRKYIHGWYRRVGL